MKISYLADHQNLIPTISAWFYHEWSYLYPERTSNDVTKSIAERINKDSIPMALVALEGNELLGTVCLKIHDMDSRPDLSPWLADLYVKKSCRRNGIGSALVKAIEKKAVQLGIRRLYLYTPDSEKFYTGLDWVVKETKNYHNVRVTVMEKEIAL